MASPSANHPTDEVPIDENTKLSDLTDRQILDLTQGIKDKEAQEHPLVGSLESIEELRREYEQGAQVFLSKIRWLDERGWRRIRRQRGDGNCFYRAFAYGFCERIMHDLSATATATSNLAKLDSLLPLLEQVGFDKPIFEDFYDPLRQILKSIADRALTDDALLSAFNDPETSSSIVVFFRLLTSAYLRKHEDAFAPFLLAFEEDYERFPAGAPSLHEFCQFYVEAVDRDADHLAIIALTQCLNVSLKVAYVDLSSTEEEGGLASVDFHSFEGVMGEGNRPAEVWEGTALLYRPGHYDLVYLSAK